MLSYLYNFVCTSSFSIFRILHGQIIVWNLKLSCKTAKLLSKLPFKSQQIAVQKSWSKCSGSRRKSIWKETFPKSFINFKTSEYEVDEILFELSIKLVCLKWNQPGESFLNLAIWTLLLKKKAFCCCTSPFVIRHYNLNLQRRYTSMLVSEHLIEWLIGEWVWTLNICRLA